MPKNDPGQAGVPTAEGGANGSLAEAVRAALEEILAQVPETVDCSPDRNLTDVLIPNGIDLWRLALAVQRALA